MALLKFDLLRGAAAAALVVLAAGSAQAQIGAYGGAAGQPIAPGALLAPPIEANGKLDLRGQAEHALILGDWLVAPSAFVGGIYDSNPNQQSGGAKGAEGLRLIASGLAERNTGISKTDIYGMVDGREYTTNTSASILTAQLGATETYSPTPDWIFNAQGDYTRQTDLFSTFGLTHSVTPQSTTGVGVQPTTNPLTYNQLTGGLNGEKRFGSVFLDLGGSAVAQLYDKSGGVGGGTNNTVYTVTGRGGLYLTPDVYGYVQASGDQRNYDTTPGSISLNSRGYRTTTGVGTNKIGLLNGEVYVGYAAENYNAASLGTRGSIVYGGQLDYTPVPELDMKLGVDRTIGATQTSATSNSTTKGTTVLALMSYAIAPEWSLSGRAAYIHTDYTGVNRADDAWTVGPTLTYSIWQSVGITFDYQHIQVMSNAAFSSFSRDVATVGLSYKY